MSVNIRKRVFALLVFNFLLTLFGFAQILNFQRDNSETLSPTLHGVINWFAVTAFLQVLGSFGVVCLSYWVATDRAHALRTTKTVKEASISGKRKP